jgi:hypothetical protein
VSYSFSVKGATKAEVIQAANDQFDKVVNGQPVHAADMPAAMTAAQGFVNTLMDDANCDTTLSVSGSVYSTSEGVRQASISINAQFSAPRA